MAEQQRDRLPCRVGDAQHAHLVVTDPLRVAAYYGGAIGGPFPTVDADGDRRFAIPGLCRFQPGASSIDRLCNPRRKLLDVVGVGESQACQIHHRRARVGVAAVDQDALGVDARTARYRGPDRSIQLKVDAEQVEGDERDSRHAIVEHNRAAPQVVVDVD